MKTSFYLTVNRRGAVKTTKNSPGLDWDEIPLYITLELPDQLFKKPYLQADITVPESTVTKEPITAEVINNVAEAIKESTGLKVLLKVVEEPKNE